MRHFWRTAFAVAVAGFALVATLDVRLARADEAEADWIVRTLCEQGNLTVCGEKMEYYCPNGGSATFKYPYSFGFTFTSGPCYPTSRISVYKDFVSNTAPIIITAPRPGCTKTPTTASPDDAAEEPSSDEEDCDV